MAKATTEYRCQACDAVSLKWMGKCTSCGGWNTLVEAAVIAAASHKGTSARRREAPGARSGPTEVREIQADQAMRMPTGIGELDRVLGGGLVLGGVVLVGGDPGVGKSTLLLQAMASIARQGARTLYVTGEESAAQTALRARRLGLDVPNLFVQAVSELSEVEAAVAKIKPVAVVVDSVQTIRATELESSAGTVSQLREVAARLVDMAQREGAGTLLVGHVTKDGQLAGPKVLEHLVDTVLAFEGERAHAFRALRTTKNRFGPSTEVGLFEMTSTGMTEVTQPSALFLSERPKHASGSVVASTSEGARSLLVEVQALVGPPGAGTPRRNTQGVDGGRLSMLLAILGRRAGVDVGACDVFVNIAGGMRVEEPALDLAIALAVASSYRDRPFPEGAIVFGELGLAGEVRGVARGGARLAEARAMGFTRAILPASTFARLTDDEKKGFEFTPVRSIEAAVDLL